MVWDTVKKVGSAAIGAGVGGLITGPAGVALGGTKDYFQGKAQDEQDRLLAHHQGLTQERKDLLAQGLQAGRERGELLTGQSMEQTGADTQDIISKRREMASSPSRAASEIRARGQQTARRARAGGASEAQQRQVEIESARASGIQEDIDKERRLGQFQDVIGNVMANQSALETGYGSLHLASQYIAPEQRDQGLLGNLFEGLGL